MTIEQDIRVVGLDLDSTLLKDDKTISPRTKKTLEHAIQRGIYILPATGRSSNAIPKCVREVDGIRYGVCSNGAAVVDLETGKELYTCKIPVKEALELIPIIEEYHTMFDCYIDGERYGEKRFCNRLEEFGIEPKIQELIQSTSNEVDSLFELIKEKNRPVEKFNMFFGDMENRARALEALKKLSQFKVTNSLVNNIEINAADCNKGSALIGFAQTKGFTVDQVMGCGDSNNDYDMVRLCGVGVAMMNGEKRIKDVADYITYTNEEDGVASAIERLCIRMNPSTLAIDK
jgi:hypothetical protein